MKVIFFSKCLKFYVDFENVIKTEEIIFGFDGNALQLVAGTSLNNDKNTRDGHQPLKKRSKDFRSD